MEFLWGVLVFIFDIGLMIVVGGIALYIFFVGFSVVAGCAVGVVMALWMGARAVSRRIFG